MLILIARSLILIVNDWKSFTKLSYLIKGLKVNITLNVTMNIKILRKEKLVLRELSVCINSF